MKFDRRLFIAFMISLAVVQGAYGIELGGGASAIVGADSSAQGSFVADNTGAVSVVSALGSIQHMGELRYVQDKIGKRAEMSFGVDNAVGDVGYSASFVPNEGMLGKAATIVSAQQTLYVPEADSIVLHAAVQAPGSNVVDVDMTADRIDSSSPASFSGSTLSQAIAGSINAGNIRAGEPLIISSGSALAKVQGHVVGSIIGTASYSGFANGKSYTITKTRDSAGQKVDSNLLMQATSKNGAGAISGVSTFNVYAAQNEKIQSAVNAAWDGDTINVAEGTYKENVVIDKSLAIKGAGSTKTIVDGDNAGSVFTIGLTNSRANVAMSGMRIQNGHSANVGGGIYNGGLGTATVTGCIISKNTAQRGGGIYNYGTAIVTGSTISENSATADGGGICNDGYATIAGSTFSKNAADYGGGIYSKYGGATVTGSTISENSAQSVGGGIYIHNYGRATVTGSTISKNTAAYGGAGIFNYGTAIVTGSTISENVVGHGYGGGIDSYGTAIVTGSTISGNSAWCGGGISSCGTATVTKSTISGNSANINGGGILNDHGTATVTDSILSGNSASLGGGIDNFGTAIVTGSTISGNSAAAGGGFINQGGIATVKKSTISGNTADWGGGIYTEGTATVADCTISGNYAREYGGGIFTWGTATVTGSTISKNIAVINGGGIDNRDKLLVGGTSQITENQATTGFGGGIYSTTGTVTFDGKKIGIKLNKAHLPSPSQLNWYQGWGVYLESGTPTKTGGFDPTKQVSGNTKI